MFDPTPPTEGHDWGVLGTAAGWSWRFIVTLVALGVVLLILVELQFVVVPLLLALLVSSVLAPLTVWFERKGIGRGVAATLTVLVMIGIMVGFALLVIPPFLKNIDTFKDAFENAGDDLYAWLSGAPFNLSHDQIVTFKANVEDTVPDLKDALVQGIKSAAPLIAQVTAMTGLTIVLTGYLLAGGDRYWQWMLGFFAPVNRPGLNQLGVSAYEKLAGYLRGTAIMAAIYGLGVGAFGLLFGVKLAGILGVVVFVLAFLPIIGAWISGALVAAMSFVSGGVWLMVAMILVLLILSQINSIFLRPYIVGDRVSLVPVVTLTTVLAGTTIAGVIGGILAVPVVATISGTLGQVRRWRSEGGVPTADPILDKRLDPDVGDD
jgi:predicted PurR-regulated permease PerM